MKRVVINNKIYYIDYQGIINKINNIENKLRKIKYAVESAFKKEIKKGLGRKSISRKFVSNCGSR